MIVAAVVQASGGLLGKVIDVYYAGDHDTKADKETARIIKQTYEPLRWKLTEGCVRILKLLERGDFLPVCRISQGFYPDLQLPEEHRKALNSELRYRMEYLRLLGAVGLVGGANGEYGITRLGMAFLEEARRRRDYQETLFHS
jgi:hypothetical protein